MPEEQKMMKAKETFNTLCRMLDNRKWNYQKDEDKLFIKSCVNGEDLPIDFIIRVNPKNEVVSYISWLPFTVSDEKRVDCALAVCVANYGLPDGNFDYDIADGEITFRLTSSYRESALGEKLFEYMLVCASATVDEYNDKFLMISKGVLTFLQFVEMENAKTD